MIEFIPNKNNGFKWYSSNGIYFKGFFYNRQNKKVEAKKALDFLSSVETTEDFIEICNSLNGMFSIVIVKRELSFIVSGASRVFPVFYKKIKNSFLLSDDINVLLLKENIEYDTIGEREFKSFGCCLGDKTLVKNIYQIQSSEYIIFDKNTILERGFTFSSAIAKYYSKNQNDLSKKLFSNFKNAFERLINSFNGKTVVIPLSGGFDSRLIAAFLQYYKYENVICYTYGKRGNIDMETSKKVASKLNFKWIFVEYTDELIDGFLETPLFKSYCKSTFHHSSMLFLQEYFAVKYLKDNNLVPKDAIFVPGHDGGALAGGYIVKVIPENINSINIVNDICKKFLNNNKDVSCLENVENVLLNSNENYLKLKPHSVYEDFIFKEISTKVIFNSANVYAFFGYEFRLPFCDEELLNSFKFLEPRLKINKKMYVDIISDFFEKFDLNFESEMQPSLTTIKFQNIKNAIKPFFPYSILKKKLRKNDWLNATKITSELEDNLKQNNLKFNQKKLSFNDINKEWYLYYCKNQIT